VLKITSVQPVRPCRACRSTKRKTASQLAPEMLGHAVEVLIARGRRDDHQQVIFRLVRRDVAELGQRVARLQPPG